MISYDSQREGWVNDRSPKWFVDMTPERIKEFGNKTFKTKKDFYARYYQKRPKS